MKQTQTNKPKREKFREELNHSEQLNQEDFKILSPEIIFNKNSQLRLSLFTPASSEEKESLEKSVFVALKTNKITNKNNNKENQNNNKINKETIFFNSPAKNLHLLIELQKNQQYNLVIFMPESNSTNSPQNYSKNVPIQNSQITDSLIVESFLEENSILNLTIISNKSILTRHYSKCKKNSKFTASNFFLQNSSSESKTVLSENAECIINTSFLTSKNNFSGKDVVIHEGKNSSSLINSKGYLINGNADTRGLIKINKPAFNAEGFQKFDILMEGDSHSISVPDLEILNNEVKCSHGSTISRIKDEDLFYFEARGIEKKDARKMLIKGFLLTGFSDEKVKNHIETLIDEVIFS